MAEKRQPNRLIFKQDRSIGWGLPGSLLIAAAGKEEAPVCSGFMAASRDSHWSRAAWLPSL